VNLISDSENVVYVQKTEVVGGEGGEERERRSENEEGEMEKLKREMEELREMVKKQDKELEENKKEKQEEEKKRKRKEEGESWSKRKKTGGKADVKLRKELFEEQEAGSVFMCKECGLSVGKEGVKIRNVKFYQHF